MGDLVEIRLLGSLHVRRADGSLVEPSDWRTRKTHDLLRILALRVGKRVPVDDLVSTLWPGAGPERGKASLRTAASQIRRVLSSDCIERLQGSVVLRGVWVDTRAFTALAGECRTAVASGHFAEAVATARQADALYLRDLEVVPGEAEDWFITERQSLRDIHAALMDDAAAAATSLRWMRDAAEFAERAIAAQPYSERAYRSAMLAYAGLGEVERAFGVYELCRSRLLDELGVDPSPQTQAVHLQLLRVDPPRDAEAPFVGREAQMTHLCRRVSELYAEGGGCIVVTGAARTGISRLLDETANACALPVHRLDAEASSLPDHLSGSIVLVDEAERRPGGELRRLATSAHEQRAGNVVLAAHHCGLKVAADNELGTLVAQGVVEQSDLTPLLSQDVHALTEALISGPPTDELVKAVQDSSSGQAGLVVDTIREWLRTGRLVHTGRGLDLCPDSGVTADLSGADHQLAQLSEQLSSREQAVLDVTAIVATGVSVGGIAAVLGGPADVDEQAGSPPDTDAVDVSRIISRLVDYALVTADDAGRFTVRTPLLRDAVRAWMRPAARRQLHRRVAERLSPPVAARVRHWVEAAEPGLACAEAMSGAVQAMDECDFAEALGLLHQVQNLVDLRTASTTDQLEVLQRLVACCEQLGLETQAEEHRAVAISLSRRQGLPLPTYDLPKPVLAPVTLLRPGRVALVERLGITASTAPSPEVEILLRGALASAQRSGDEDDEAEARLLLAGLVLVPRRRFAEARRLVRDGRDAGSADLDSLRLLTLDEGDILLAGPSIELSALDRAWQQSPGIRGLASGLPASVLRALARHHQNEPDADTVCDEAVSDAESGQFDGPWRWVVARILVERGELDRAHALTDGAPWRAGGPTAQILALLGRAALCLADGDTESAAVALLRGVEIGGRTGATLLLPEVASRLVMVGEEIDHDSAPGYLDLAESALGEAAMGRERVTIMLARARMRASAGRPVAAAEVAAQAGALATSLGLTYAAREAAAHRADYLDVVPDTLPRRERGRSVRHSSSGSLLPS